MSRMPFDRILRIIQTEVYRTGARVSIWSEVWLSGVRSAVKNPGYLQGLEDISDFAREIDQCQRATSICDSTVGSDESHHTIRVHLGDLLEVLNGVAEPNVAERGELTLYHSFVPRASQAKLIKIGAKVVRHARYVTFQMAAVAVPRKLFRTILERIQRLWSPPLWVPG